MNSVLGDFVAKAAVTIGVLLLLAIAVKYIHEDGYDEGVAFQKQEQQDADLKRTVELRNDKIRIELAANDRVAAANHAADSARTAANGLQQKLNSVERILDDYPNVKPVGTTAPKTVRVLTDVLRQSIQRNLQLASFADAAYNASATCYAQYSTLTEGSK